MVSVEGSGIAQNRRHDKSMGVWEGVKRGPVAKQDERFATEAELLNAGGGRILWWEDAGEPREGIICDVFYGGRCPAGGVVEQV